MRFSENRVIKLPDRNRGALSLTLGSEISARSIPVGSRPGGFTTQLEN